MEIVGGGKHIGVAIDKLVNGEQDLAGSSVSASMQCSGLLQCMHSVEVYMLASAWALGTSHQTLMLLDLLCNKERMSKKEILSTYIS